MKNFKYFITNLTTDESIFVEQDKINEVIDKILEKLQPEDIGIIVSTEEEEEVAP